MEAKRNSFTEKKVKCIKIYRIFKWQTQNKCVFFYGSGEETELTIGLDRAASRSDEELEKVLSSTAMEGQKQKQGRKQTDRHLKTAMDEDSEDEKMESKFRV